MRFGWTSRLLCAGAATLALPTFQPSAGATPLQLVRELEGPGLSVTAAGAGLLRGRSATLTVNVPGPVSLALLVWSGRGPCRTDPATSECGLGAEPYADQELRFDGAALKGEVAGFELRPEGQETRIMVGYMADVTEAVAARGPGSLSFSVADPDRHNDLQELEGAGLLVVYTDPAVAGSARVMVHLGLDFAYGESAERDDRRITQPFSFIHGGAKASRRADLLLFAGGAEEGRPDRIDISNNRSVVDRLDGLQGQRWDVLRLAAQVPGGAGTTTVQILSEPVGENPDSISWVLAALRLPLPAPAGCAAAFWHAREDAWRGLRPSQRLRDVFNLRTYDTLSGATLGTALRFKDGPGLLGAAKALLREGSAALLNAVHPTIEYPLLRLQVTRRVSDALATRDPGVVLAAADELKALNTSGCPLN
jgi:hypothetical protein